MYALYLLAVSSSSNNDKTKYRNMIVSIILNSKTPIAVNNVFRLFKNKYCYDFPLKIFGCISVMDFFRLHPALFKVCIQKKPSKYNNY